MTDKNLTDLEKLQLVDSMRPCDKIDLIELVEKATEELIDAVDMCADNLHDLGWDVTAEMWDAQAKTINALRAVCGRPPIAFDAKGKIKDDAGGQTKEAGHH